VSVEDHRWLARQAHVPAEWRPAEAHPVALITRLFPLLPPGHGND
jgi:hypothetical protein